jgi:hypothetical protein
MGTPPSIALRAAAACVLFVALLGTGASGWLGMQRLHDEGGVELAAELQQSRTLAQTRHLLSELRRLEKDMVIHVDRVDEVERHFRHWQDVHATARDLVQRLASAPEHAVDAQHLLARLDGYARQFEPVAQQLLARAVDNAPAANRLLGAAKQEAHGAEKAALAIDRAIARNTDATIAATHIGLGQRLALHGIVVGVALALALPAAIAAMTWRAPRRVPAPAPRPAPAHVAVAPVAAARSETQEGMQALEPA